MPIQSLSFLVHNQNRQFFKKNKNKNIYWCMKKNPGGVYTGLSVAISSGDRFIRRLISICMLVSSPNVLILK